MGHYMWWRNIALSLVGLVCKRFMELVEKVVSGMVLCIVDVFDFCVCVPK